MSAELTRWQKTNFGIILPMLVHGAVSAFHWLVLLPMSSGEVKGWNLIVLSVFLPMVVGISAIMNCWVFGSDPRNRLSCFLHGLWIPAFAYAAILAFTIHLYREADRNSQPSSASRATLFFCT